MIYSINVLYNLSHILIWLLLLLLCLYDWFSCDDALQGWRVRLTVTVCPDVQSASCLTNRNSPSEPAGSLQVTNRKVERVRMVKVNVLYRHSAIWIHRWNNPFFLKLPCFALNVIMSTGFYKSLHAATILAHYISIITIAVIKVKQ